MHDIIRKNPRQSLSVPQKSGKKANWSELFPELLIEELWLMIQSTGIPGRFHLQRLAGAPRRGKNGCLGVRVQNLNASEHLIYLVFQNEMKGAQARFSLEPPNPGDAVPDLTRIRTQLDELSQRRDRKGDLDIELTRTAPAAAQPPAPQPAPKVSESVEVRTEAPAVAAPTSTVTTTRLLALDWEAATLHATLMRFIRDADQGYPEGWIPMRDMVPLVELALEACGMEQPSELDGRKTKRLFTLMVDGGMLERSGKAHSIKYRECRKKQLQLSGNLVEDVKRLAELATRFTELSAQLVEARRALEPLQKERNELTARLEQLAADISGLERGIEAAEREIESDRLDEAAEMRRQLLQSLQG